MTALLFNLGSSPRLAHRHPRTGVDHGAATSLVLVLGWVYYASQIVLFGAEITHVIPQRGNQAQPEPL